MRAHRHAREWIGAGFVALSATALALLAGGCQTVKPWERGYLGDAAMRPDRDPLTDTLREHVHFTREAATGGRGVGGGGCGCN
jgi:hypothetical protein